MKVWVLPVINIRNIKYEYSYHLVKWEGKEHKNQEKKIYVRYLM